MIDERITWDQYVHTVLALRQTMGDRSEDELFEDAWAFLSRAWVRYNKYRYNLPPPNSWDHEPFIGSLLSPETAVFRLTGKQGKAAMAALEQFLGPELFKEMLERGGLSANFCDQMKEEYQKWRNEPVRAKQRQVGKETKNLRRGARESKKIA